jgi:N-acyl-L-homoserine lactone synthetase
VGSVRVVPDGVLGLPLERYAPLNGYKADKMLVEFSRLAVDKVRGGPRVGALLMKAAFQRAELVGATHVVLDTVADNERILRYEKVGFARLGQPYVDTYHLRAMRSLTMSQRVADVREVWPAARPGLHRFFTSLDPCIDHSGVGNGPGQDAR